MSKKDHYLLTPAQLEELLTAIRQDKRADVVRRAHVLLELHKGARVKDVEATSGVGRTTFWRWHARFVADGTDALHDAKKQGRPRKASPAYIAELEQTMASEPTQKGYTFQIWTAERLGEHLTQETGIHLGQRTLGELLRSLGYVYRRPKQSTHHLQDPEAVAVATANLETLKKGRVKESTSSSLWMKPPVNPTPTSANAG